MANLLLLALDHSYGVWIAYYRVDLDYSSAMVWDDGKCISYIAFRLLDIITWMIRLYPAVDVCSCRRISVDVISVHRICSSQLLLTWFHVKYPISCIVLCD